MAEAERLICESAALVDSGRGVRFEVEYFGEAAPAFVFASFRVILGSLRFCTPLPLPLSISAQPLRMRGVRRRPRWNLRGVLL